MLDNTISNEAYHADVSALTSSMLKTLAITPAHFYDRYLSDNERPEPSRAMIRGTMIHTMVLEPTWFDDRHVVIPEGLDRRTKEGKALWAELQASGKQPITSQEYQDTMAVFKSIMSHPVSRIIFQTEGMAETTLRWTDETGVECKCRPDYMIPPNVSEQFPNGLIVDIKSTADAVEQSFRRQAYNLGYHISAAHYTQGFKAEFGTRPAFLFCVAEKSRPFLSRYFAAGSEFMSMGESEVRRLISLYIECSKTNRWPGYPTNVQTLELPDFVLKQLAYEAQNV